MARLTTDPSDRGLRESVLEAGSRLSISVRRTAAALDDRLDDIGDRLSATVLRSRQNWTRWLGSMV